MDTRNRTLGDMVGGYIDSCDIRDRLAELEGAAAEEPSDLGCAACSEGSAPDGEYGSLDGECADELRALKAIDEEGSQSFADWQYGETLIPESEFESYAEELAEDIGAIDRNASWPLSYIDWTAAANALKMDYSGIEIEGTTYLGRS